jgi:hypothetical protein
MSEQMSWGGGKCGVEVVGVRDQVGREGEGIKAKAANRAAGARFW